MKNNTRHKFNIIKQDFEEKWSHLDTHHNDSSLNISKVDTESLTNKSISDQDYILNNDYYRNKILSKLHYKYGFRPTFLGGLHKSPLSITNAKIKRSNHFKKPYQSHKHHSLPRHQNTLLTNTNNNKSGTLNRSYQNNHIVSPENTNKMPEK